ncbi:MAG TPA: dihydrolipoamide acetyltransferase family protein [Streptosporangiaceae bacterium]
MSELRQFKLPDVGEGLTEADIVKWLVQAGDTVKVNQIIVEIETAKAVVELPSPHAGTVASLLVTEGETVDVGTPIISFEVAGGAGSSRAGSSGGAGSRGQGQDKPSSNEAGAAPDMAAALAEPGPLQTPTAEDLVPQPPPAASGEAPNGGSKPERQAVLVGYGVKLGATTRRARKPGAARRPAAVAASGPAASAAPTAPAAASAAPAPAGTADSAGPGSTGPASAGPASAGPASTGPGSAGPGSTGSGSTGSGSSVLAKPPVRKLARDLGVDLAALSGTGPNGSITRDDVQAAVAAPEPGYRPADGLAPLSSLAREERIAVRGVRKHTAAAMTASAFTAPHVTMFLQIDITETMAATARLKAMPDFEGIRVSPLLLVARALLVAAGRHPMINSSWDEDAQDIVVRHYVNLGIAAATERGLVVPNIKDAHALSLPDLARALGELAETARAGKSSPADLGGGTISITNVGVFGVDTGTPILPPGEAAILAFGQVKDAPWVVDGELTVRKVCTLGMSFDHRIIDGDLGAAVLRDVGAMLSDPLRMLAWT